MGPATSCGKKLTKATNEIKSSEGFIFFCKYQYYNLLFEKYKN